MRMAPCTTCLSLLVAATASSASISWAAAAARGLVLRTCNRSTWEHVLTLSRGDAVFHHSWTVHATAPNETEQKRRGWALHYADAKSKWGDHHRGLCPMAGSDRMW